MLDAVLGGFNEHELSHAFFRKIPARIIARIEGESKLMLFWPTSIQHAKRSKLNIEGITKPYQDGLGLGITGGAVIMTRHRAIITSYDLSKKTGPLRIMEKVRE